MTCSNYIPALGSKDEVECPTLTIDRYTYKSCKIYIYIFLIRNHWCSKVHIDDAHRRLLSDLSENARFVALGYYMMQVWEYLEVWATPPTKYALEMIFSAIRDNHHSIVNLTPFGTRILLEPNPSFFLPSHFFLPHMVEIQGIDLVPKVLWLWDSKGSR